MAAPLFHRAHYNIIAARIKSQLDSYYKKNPHEFYGRLVTRSKRELIFVRSDALTKLALSMAARFVEDNPEFDPIKWLDQCSPDPDLYPLSELWADYIGE